MTEEETVNRLEAVLFLTPRPLSVKEIAKILDLPEEEVLEGIQKLKTRYEGTALFVEEFLNSYRLNVREEFRDLAKKLGLAPEFSRRELKIIGELLQKGEIRLSELKRHYKGWKEFLEKMRSYGFVTTTKSGRSIIIKKTKLLERYFGVTH